MPRSMTAGVKNATAGCLHVNAASTIMPTLWVVAPMASVEYIWNQWLHATEQGVVCE